MTFEELRAKADEDFKDPATREFWMKQVNEMLEKNPTLFQQWQKLKVPSPDAGIEYRHKEVDKGGSEVQFKHAFKYYYNVPPDYTEAVKWFRMAAEQGHSSAQGYLGQCYAKGTGVAKDEVESAKWYRRAAEQGDELAQYILGYNHEYGIGVVKDFIEAGRWYRKAAEQGHKKAQSNLKILEARINQSPPITVVQNDASPQSPSQHSRKTTIGFSETERTIFRFAKNIFFKVAKIVQMIIVTIIILIIVYLILHFMPGTDFGFWRP